MAMTKVKKLQQWCKQIVEGYPDVAVTDMTSSWKNGLAFCAIIHRFRPDLINFDSLSKENVFDNNQLAFEVAENELGISALLEAQDMVAIRVPDRLSVVTYVSQYYNYFHDKPKLGGPGVKTNSLKRHQSPDDVSAPQAKRFTAQNNTKQTERKSQGSIGDKCTICHEKVYLLERLMENNKLYHRTCFRQSDLSPTSKIYSRPMSPGTPQRGRDSGKAANLVARLNELKKSTASINRGVDQPSVSNKQDNRNTAAMPEWKQPPSDMESDSPRIGTPRQGSSQEVSPDKILSENIVHTDKSVGDKSPGAKPKAKPRGSIKGKEDLKSVEKDGMKAPPRKKPFKSVPLDTASVTDLPPSLPASTPPSLARNLSPTRPSPRPNTKSPPLESLPFSTPDKHSSQLHSSHKPSSPPGFKHQSNSESPRETSTPSVNLKTKKTIHSNIFEKDLVIDNAPPKPPRSLPRGTTLRDAEQAVKLPDHGPFDAVSPGTKRDHGDNVLSGLLKNLANVRHKGDSAASSKHDYKRTNLNISDMSHRDRPVTSSDMSHRNHPVTLPDTSNRDRPVTTSDTSNRDRPVTTSDTSNRDRPVTSSDRAKPRVMKRAVITSSKVEGTSIIVKDDKATERPTKPTGNTDNDLQANKKLENNPGKEIKSGENVPAWKNLRKVPAKTDENSGEIYNRSRNEQAKGSKHVQGNVSVNSQTDKARPARPKTPEVLSKKHIKDNVSVSSGQIEKNTANQGTEPQSGALKTVTNDKSNKKPEVKHKLAPIPSEINTEKSLKKITVDVKFDFEEAGSKQENPKSPRPPRPPQPSPQDVKEPRRSIKKHRAPNSPRSPGWLKDGDFRKMTTLEIQNQLVKIDSKLTDLEIRGRHLEDSIRRAPEEDESMMIEWFQMVNEKNELIRKEADLIYASRTQELEDEQQDIDRQIRELLEKPEGDKTEEEKQEEELLLQKLIDVVNQRSVIVDSQDEDRIRYQEEDRDIAVMLKTKGFVQKTH